MAEADSEESGSEKSTGGALLGLLKALGTMLGLHIQYAQREARDDIGRIITAIVLIVCAVLFAFLALVFGHLALIQVLQARTTLVGVESVGAVAAGDLLLGLLLLTIGRGRLRKPVLEQTRSLVKRTVSSLADV